MSVCVLGGYGTFGKLIVDALLADNISVTLAGRTQTSLDEFVVAMQQRYPDCSCSGQAVDADNVEQVNALLATLKPKVVINTCGPFQTKNYAVAEACINAKVNYIDLADGREFVCGIKSLHAKAEAAGVLVVSGASTVPALSSAVINNYKDDFASIDKLIYGITPGQQSPRGLATTRSILTYLGKPILSKATVNVKRYGWQNIYRQQYPELGKRWMANCDAPDLDLFVDEYGTTDIHFSAGMESSLLHLGMWLCSWCVRLRLPINFAKHAKFLLRASHWFDRFGSDAGGMHVTIIGRDKAGNKKTITWFLLATTGDGPRIPTIPAVVLAQKILRGENTQIGAYACVGLVSLSEYLAALEQYSIQTYVS